MSRKTSVTQAPYDDKGNLRSYVGYGEPEWRANEPFSATLRLVSWARGRSSVTFDWEDADGHRFSMFVSDFFELVTSVPLTNNTVYGKWIVRKSGQNYGIARYTD